MRSEFRRLIPVVLILAACKSGDGAPTGALTVTVSGLPSTPASIVVTGPNSYSHTVTATTTLSNLPSGTYTVTASNVVTGTATYAPSPATTGVSITTTTLNAAVNYTLASGGLALTMSGLPGGVSGNVTVTGPGGFSQVATASQTWTNITPGSYVVTANVVASGSSTYGGTPPTQTIVVPASLTNATATETYSLMTGQITVTVNGLPGGLNPSVLVTGPFAYSHAITTSGATVLSALPLGTYTIAASNVSNATATYAAGANQTVTLAAGALSGAKTVTYAISTGSLTVTVTGLPGGTNAAITVTGPSSFSQSVTATTTINKLTPGTYTTTASNVTVGPTTYVPSPTTQTNNVVASVTASNAAVAYSSVAGLNLTIAGMYVTQGTQSFTDTVPLVANKDGYLRVFVLANQANSVTPKVRVRWYSGASLIQTDTISAPGASVPTAVAEGTWNSSWNIAVPKARIAANLKVLADVDPANLVPESSESDNSFPVSGTPFALNVKTLSIFHQMIIPVKTKKDGLLGNVTAGNQASYLVFLQKVHPVPSTTQTLHATYTTIDSLDVLQSGDGNLMWETVLNEITAVRSAEATTPLLDSTYYYGVVHPNYGGGVAGLGWIGYPAAIGWDNGQNDQILAHETGHNWGRNHSPGCGAAGVDPGYPNATGNLDAYGVDVATATPTTATVYTPAADFDLMSYCRPYWIANYTYLGVMNYRLSSPDIAAANVATGPESVLLVWGRMTNGKLVLEPGFEITARARMPEGHGAYRIEGLDANGAVLFSYAFEGLEAGDAPNPSRGFAFNIPVRQFDIARLATLRLAGQGAEARREGGPIAAAMSVGSAPPSGLLARLRGGLAHVTWDHRTYPMAMVRDRRTGQVLSFARGGSVDVPASDLEVVLSNGVRSVTERVTAQ